MVACLQQTVVEVVNYLYGAGSCLPPTRPVVERVVWEVDQACQRVFPDC